MHRSVVSVLAGGCAAVLVVPLLPASSAVAAPYARVPGRAVRSVELITGDVVALIGSGPSRGVVVPRSRAGVSGVFTTYRLGGDQYVVPGVARRYVGTVLDPSLFDVTALARNSSNARFAVSVRLAAGTAAVVPGLTVTSRTAGAEQGYLTRAGARAFGAALAKQTVADGVARHVPGRLFGGVTRIAAAGAVASHPVTPAFQQYTLQIKVTDPGGRPADFADVLLMNVDDGRKFMNFLPVINGLAKVSVPAGSYSGLAVYDGFTRTSFSEYLVPREQFDVTRSGQAMVFDTRAATVTPSVRTPRPAQVASETLEWDRATKRAGTGIDFLYDSSVAVRVAPTPRVSKGRLDWITNWALASHPSTGAGYTYDLSFHDSGSVPAHQHRTVTTGQLARVTAHYYTDDRTRSGYFDRGPTYPGLGGGWTSVLPLAMPVARTEYAYASHTGRFYTDLNAAPTDEDPFQGWVSDPDRAYPAGTNRAVDWLRGPLAPGIPAQIPGEVYGCTACRDATHLLLVFAPYADTTPGHFGTFDLTSENQVAGRFQLYRNGTLIDNKTNYNGDLVTVPRAAATYRAVTTVHRKIAGFRTSTDTTEDVTFRSSAASGPSGPRGWLCPEDPPCTVLPILSATMPLPTDGQSRLPTGSTPVIFSIGYNQHAAPATIGDVTVATTTNNGATYRTLPVTPLGHGKYRVTLTNPASSLGHGIGLRIGAGDSAGGALVETVHNAYVVTRR